MSTNGESARISIEKLAFKAYSAIDNRNVEELRSIFTSLSNEEKNSLLLENVGGMTLFTRAVEGQEDTIRQVFLDECNELPISQRIQIIEKNGTVNITAFSSDHILNNVEVFRKILALIPIEQIFPLFEKQYNENKGDKDFDEDEEEFAKKTYWDYILKNASWEVLNTILNMVNSFPEQAAQLPDTVKTDLIQALENRNLKILSSLMGSIQNKNIRAVKEKLDPLSKEQRHEILNLSLIVNKFTSPEEKQSSFTALGFAAYCQNSEIVKILKDCGATTFGLPNDNSEKMVKEVGHVIGAKGTISILDRNKAKRDVPMEGNNPLESFLLLETLLKEYQADLPKESNSSKHFETVVDTVSQTTNYLKFDDSVTAEMLHQRFISGECTMLAAGWIVHQISVMLYGDCLVLANRGDREKDDIHKEGTRVYRIKNKDLITPDFIKSLYDFPGGTQKEVMDQIKTVIDMDNPVASFPTKDQKYGNCSLVNPKATIEPIIYFIYREQLKKLHPEKSDLELDAEAASYARTEYKKFTHYIRERTIDRVIKIKDKSLSKQLAAAILASHHGQKKGQLDSKSDRSVKIEQELQRALALLESFTAEERKEIIIDAQSKYMQYVDFLYYAAQSETPETKRLVPLLKEAGVNPTLSALAMVGKKDPETGVPALISLVHKNADPEIVRRLLSGLSDPSIDPKIKIKFIHEESNLGNTAIIVAAMFGHMENLKSLLEALPDTEQIKALHHKNKAGNSAFDLATARNRPETAVYLQELEARLTAKNKQELTFAFDKTKQSVESEEEDEKHSSSPKQKG